MSKRSYDVGYEDGLEGIRSCSVWECDEDERDYHAGYDEAQDLLMSEAIERQEREELHPA